LAFILLFYTICFSTCGLENSVALSALPLGVKYYTNPDENKLKILKPCAVPAKRVRADCPP